MIWKLVGGLDRLRARYLERLDASGRERPTAQPAASAPHPAIEQFLRKLRSDRAGA